MTRLNTAFVAMIGTMLLAQPTFAEIQTKTVEYRDGDQVMRGYLAYDDAIEGKRPGVLVIHEFWGLNDYARKRARMLAELGYVAFAADMYGEGRESTHAQEASAWAGEVRAQQSVLRARAIAGLNTLKEQPNVDASRLAAIGYCFGGSAVLQLAYSGADVKAVVSFHGHPMPPAEEEHAGIKATIVVCNGANDTAISAEQVQAFEQAMKKAGADWMFVNYGNAVHSFTNPSADGKRSANSKYNPEADRRSWALMKSLFVERFE